MNLDDLRPIAADVHDARPDWDLRGILGALWEHRDRGTLPQLTAAALRAARTPASRTPAAIGFEANWRPVSEEPAGPLPYDPLPECSDPDCAYPVARSLSATLTKCPACGLPWVPYQQLHWTPEHPDTDDADQAAAVLLERLRVNVGAARAALGHVPVAAGDETAARAVRCPWCHAEPGIGCVVPATGRPLKLTAAHPSRHEAAGVGPPRVAVDELAARRSRRDGPRRLPAPEAEEATS